MGIIQRGKRWYAYITINYKYIHLGSWETKEEAIKARKMALIQYNFHENHGKRLTFSELSDI